MTKPVIVIAGLGRCGSSMTMQMLHASGTPCVGRSPSFEDDHTMQNVDAEWLSQQSGRAVKVLDPQRVGIPQDVNCAVIWLDRDTKEQAKSQIKLVEALDGIRVASGSWRVMRGILRSDRTKAMAIIVRYPVLKLSFEGILSAPRENAVQIADFLSPWFDISDRIDFMAMAVRRRSPVCAPGLAMEMTLMAESLGSRS
jgi:hypothetical protein